MTELHVPATPVARGGDQYSLNLDDSVYNRLLKERIIFLGSEVNDQVGNRICAQLLLLAADDPERDINLYINSPGGSVSAGMAIYDTMQFIDNDVQTVAMGMAASMGQLLLCAGTAGKRRLFAVSAGRRSYCPVGDSSSSSSTSSSSTSSSSASAYSAAP